MAGIDEYTVLLLQSETTHGSTTFTDTGGGTNCPHTIARDGTPIHSTAQAKFGSSSVYFDGSGDYLYISDSADWDFGTSDFTFDSWVYFSSIPSSVIMTLLGTYQNATTGFTWQVRTDTSPYRFSFGLGNSTQYVNWTPSAGQWYHLATVRSSGQLLFFVNGTQVGVSQANTWNITGSTSSLYINGYNGSPFPGYMEEVRISKGIARWTSDFTPPTEPYSAISTAFTDIPLDVYIAVASTNFTDVPLDIYIVAGVSLTDVPLDINIQRQYFTNIPLDVYIAGKSYKNIPLDILIDIALYMGDVPLNIHIMDGKFFVDIPLNLSIVKTIPSFKSIVLQRIASILHDIT